MSLLRREAPVLLLLLLIAAAPSVGSVYLTSLLTRASILGLAALATGLLVGGAGLVSFGQAAMLGIGAYAVAVLDANRVTDAAVVLPVAAVAAGVFALATGAVAVRLSGVPFIMITLAFSQMAFFLAASLASYGGDDGYSLYSRNLVFGTAELRDRAVFHLVCVAALALGFVLCRVVLASRFGRVLRAVRENPLRVQAIGFSPYAYRLAAYGFAGALCGVAGFLLANAAEFVSPAYLAWQRSGDLLFMAILGGIGGLHGAIIGALAFVVLEDVLSGLTEHWRLLFGPLLILIVLFLPGGLVGLPSRLGGGRRG